MKPTIRLLAGLQLGCAGLIVSGAIAVGGNAQAQTSGPTTGATQAPLSPPRNAQSRRYEVHQTFDGQAFRKDSNVWVVNSEFAETFGMPQSFVGPITGAVAAAFRIEEASYQWCGYGGKAENCKRDEQCLLDLYFDESKTPLPWATDLRSQWLPWQASLKWLRWGDRNPTAAGPLPDGINVNRVSSGGIVPFADPDSKWQAIFTSNRGIGNNRPADDEVSGSLGIYGYQRAFYRTYTMVVLQLGCTSVDRKSLVVRLDAREDVYGKPHASFVRSVLPEQFIVGMNATLDTLSKRNVEYFRRLLTPPTTGRSISVPAQNTTAQPLN